MTVKQLTSFLRENIQPGINNITIYKDSDILCMEDFNKNYEQYQHYIVSSYEQIVDDPSKTLYRIHIREPKDLYIVKSGQIKYYTIRENIDATIDRLFSICGNGTTISIAKTNKTI